MTTAPEPPADPTADAPEQADSPGMPTWVKAFAALGMLVVLLVVVLLVGGGGPGAHGPGRHLPGGGAPAEPSDPQPTGEHTPPGGHG